MDYILKHMDKDLLSFSVKGKTIFNLIMFKDFQEALPLPLKRIVKQGYSEEFVDSETEDSYFINEYGCELFDMWLSNRQIPNNRDNLYKYLSDDKTPRDLLLSNYGFSYTDNYWIVPKGSGVSWEYIKSLRNDLNTIYQRLDIDGKYWANNSSLGGQLEKFWYKSGNNIFLCKICKDNWQIICVRELIASIIYERQKVIPYCHYGLIFKEDTKKVNACFTKCFTSDKLELITAYDLLEEYNLTQVDDIYDKIIDLAIPYGLSREEVQYYMDVQTIVDFLITNRDRHQNNIGFLRDADTLRLVSCAPVFDSGSSVQLEGVSPEDVINTTVNSLYRTEAECLYRVKDFNVVNISLLPSIGNVIKLS